MTSPIVTLKSLNIWAGDGVTVQWNFSFAGGYISKSTVKAYIEDALGARTTVAVTDAMFAGPYQLNVYPAVPVGSNLVIYRDSANGGIPLVKYTDRSGIPGTALNTTAMQSLFVAIEAQDALFIVTPTELQDLGEEVFLSASAAANSAITAANSAVAAANSAIAAATSAVNAAFSETAVAGAVAAYSASLAAPTGGSLVGVQDTGTGAVARSVLANIRDFLNVKNYGAIGDGVADDTLALEKAHAVAATRVLSRFNGPGCAVIYPAGTYRITRALASITTSNIVLVGQGPAASIIKPDAGNYDAITFDGLALALYSVGMFNMRIYCAGGMTGGRQLVVNRAINSMFVNLQLIGWYDGLASDGCAKTYFHNVVHSQENRTSGTTLRYAYDFTCTASVNSDVHVSNYQITFDTAIYTYGPTVSIRGADGIYFSNGHQFGGVLIQPVIDGAHPTGPVMSSVKWNNVYFDTSNAFNVKFQGTSAAYRNFVFTGCNFRNSGGNAFEFAASSVIDRIIVTSGDFDHHRLYAIYHPASAPNVTNLIVGLTNFNDSNYNNAALTGDILFNGRGTFAHNRFQGGGAAGTAIQLGANSQACIVDGNDLTQTTVSGKAITDSGTSNKIRGNPGFRTKNRGQVTITNPATSATVSHGLDLTPLAGMIRANFSGADAAGVTRYRITNLTATTFDIICNATPTTTAQFDWTGDEEF